MSDEPSGDLIWSRERWFMTITIIFAVQVVVVIWLSGRGKIPTEKVNPRLQAHYYTPKMSAELAPLLRLMDPTMYVRASSEGFSGSVWLNVEPVNHRSSGWSDPPQFLKFKPDKLLSDLEEFGDVAEPVRQRVPAKLTGSAGPRTAVSHHLKLAPETRFDISGALKMADLQNRPTLPSIQFDGVLAPTTLVLQVDQRGRVFSVNLAGTSGLPKADDEAMKIARALRFNVAEGFSTTRDNRDFGNLRQVRFSVYWWTIPVPVPAHSTNAPTVGPVQ